MAETKPTAAQKTAAKKVEKESTKDVLSYVSMKELDKEQLKTLPQYNVQVELRGKGDNLFPVVSVLFSKYLKKTISSKSFDIRKYNLLLKRRNLNPNEKVHIIPGIFRFFEGPIPNQDRNYKRLEMYLMKGMVITEFFDWNDIELIESYDIPLEFTPDPNNKVTTLYGELVEPTIDDWL